VAQAEIEEKASTRMRQMTRIRSFVTLGFFVNAMVLSLEFPIRGFGTRVLSGFLELNSV
jgi:hypothetical protein